MKPISLSLLSRGLRRLALACACAVACSAALAAYPDKPIKVLTPFPPGGQVPTMAYILSQKMGALLGQPVVLETRAGAAGSIAASMAAKSPRDGYTLLFATSSMLGIAKYMNKDLAYDPVTDFAPVVYLGNVTVGVFASPQASFSNLDQLIAAAKANPGRINFSSPGIGSVSHLAAELIKVRAGIDLTHVPYQGFAAQMTDLIGGRTELAMGGMASGLAHVKDGRVRLIAVAARTRSRMMPDVPAVAEKLPGYDAPAWLGIVAPAGIPAEAQQKLEWAAQEALKDPETVKALEAQGLDMEVMLGRAFGDKIRRDLPLWEEAVKASGARPPETR